MNDCAPHFADWGAAAVATTFTFFRAPVRASGERRSFALLRPIADVSAQKRMRELVLRAYAEHEASVAAVPQ